MHLADCFRDKFSQLECLVLKFMSDQNVAKVQSWMEKVWSLQLEFEAGWIELGGKRTETSDRQKLALATVLLTHNLLSLAATCHRRWEGRRKRNARRWRKFFILPIQKCWCYFVQSDERTRYQWHWNVDVTSNCSPATKTTSWSTIPIFFSWLGEDEYEKTLLYNLLFSCQWHWTLQRSKTQPWVSPVILLL